MTSPQKNSTWLGSIARVVAFTILCTVVAVLLLLALLFAWTGVDLLTGGIPYPPGQKMSWKVPFFEFVAAAASLLAAWGLCHIAADRVPPSMVRDNVIIGPDEKEIGR